MNLRDLYDLSCTNCNLKTAISSRCLLSTIKTFSVFNLSKFNLLWTSYCRRPVSAWSGSQRDWTGRTGGTSRQSWGLWAPSDPSLLVAWGLCSSWSSRAVFYALEAPRAILFALDPTRVGIRCVGCVGEDCSGWWPMVFCFVFGVRL